MNEWEFYSPKDKYHALKYEVAVSLNPNSRIVWLSGPFKGAAADVTIARRELIPLLRRDGEQMLADMGYEGPVELISPFKAYAGARLTNAQIRHNTDLQRERLIIERANHRLKIFGVLGGIWRHHDIEYNALCCRVVAKITNVIFLFQPL